MGGKVGAAERLVQRVQVLDERHWMVARSHEVDGGVRRRPREIRVVEGCV